MYIVHHFILLGSIPLTLVLIERDGDLSTLCHSCGFDYQLRVQKRSLALAMSALRMGQSDYDIYWQICTRFSFTNILDSQGSIRRGKVGISLTPHYHFHLLCRHLEISRAITAEKIETVPQKHGNTLLSEILLFYVYALFQKFCTLLDSEPATPLQTKYLHVWN